MLNNTGRHAGGSRHPVCFSVKCRCATWIPAFAGMTLLFLFSQSSALAQESKMLWLPPGQEVFPLPVADPRSAQFALRVFRSDGKTLSEGAIGHQIPLARFKTGASTLQLGLEASAFIRLSLAKEGQNAALETSDWFFGFPIEYRCGPWAFRLWPYHTSSHLGDNFLIKQGLTPQTYSRESLEALAAYSIGGLTLYAGGSQTVHTIPDVNGFALHGGAQVRSRAWGNEKLKQLYAAIDLQPKGEVDWRIQNNVQAGLALRGSPEGTRMRLYLNYATGPSAEGQFFRGDQSFWAGGVAFDF